MATFLLRDGSKVTADIILPQVDVFVYETDGGKSVQVVLSVEAEQFLLNSVPSKVVLLRRRMETAYKRQSA